MSVVVVILGDSEAPVAIAAGTAHALARLGVTEMTLTDGRGGSAIVLTGWAFDGRRHEQDVIALVAPGRTTTVLHGIADVILRPDETRAAEKYST